MKKISIYVRNSQITPSSYYRIIQYVSDLSKYYDISIKEGVDSAFYSKILSNKKLKKKILLPFFYFILQMNLFKNLMKDIFSYKPNIIFISKTFSPKYTLLLNKFLILILTKRSQIIWDFDDDIINSKEISYFQKEILLRRSSKIIVTHNLLKNTVPKNFQNKVVKLPTTDGSLIFKDTDNVKNIRLGIYNEKINIVWVGTHYNLSNLNILAPSIDKLARNNQSKKINLIVICNKKYNYNFKYANLINKRWKREEVKKILLKAHIGVMPLEENEYNSKKGGFKIIQYLSSGIPIIASNVGINKDIVGDDSGYVVNDDWESPLQKLAFDKANWENKSESAIIRYNLHYSYDNNLSKLLRLFEVS
ncbi:glycosyltransferase [Enterococcus sp. 1001283B150225_161107_E12]|uniref:glycosyltransferase n=1 Tax=Enterococcus sp. 1001283B150225_161107_E12 TaxID=2787145 RepID=UPI00189E5F2B|nr:glycosyltransferase [Enterococcus sp. 1001283B150225_161107_E12]